ncbi:hypothetical protein ES703_60598 [subsurface metagenome]
MRNLQTKQLVIPAEAEYLPIDWSFYNSRFANIRKKT